MKTIRVFCIFLIFTSLSSVLLFVSGCTKDDSDENEPVKNTDIKDRDGNIYTSVKIGTQTWLVENLKTRTYRNGDSIPTTTRDVSGETAPKYQWAYDNDQRNVNFYGRLYTWNVITDSRGICPVGWHVPSDQEWESLKSYLGTGAGGKLKETGTLHWNPPNTGATNETGFTAVPGGYRSFEGEFVSLGISNYFWSTTPDNNRSWGQRLFHSDANSERWSFNRQAGVTVRCLKD